MTCEDKPLGPTYCSRNNVIREFQTSRCTTLTVTLEECPDGCSNGKCIGECDVDSDCSEDEKCFKHRCLPINCKCGYPVDHGCFAYPCCVDEQCKPGQYCDTLSHTCSSIACTPVSYNGFPARKLDIVFVGDGYSVADQEKFKEDVRKHSDQILSTKPFSTYKSKINIYRVDLFKDLGCKIYGDRCLICDEAKAAEIASECPNDKIIILANIDQWAGCAGMYGMAHVSAAFPIISLHEFGHSFGGLWDEYSYGDFTLNVSRSPNCDSSSQCSKWDTIPGSECYQQCTANGYYRSIKRGIMREASRQYGSVNEMHMRELLNRYD